MWFGILNRFLDNYYNQFRIVYKILAFVGALSYLSYHLFSGKNGYNSYKEISCEVFQKQRELSELKKEVDELKLKVEHLSNKSLDLDLLEERCRVMLNYAYPEDVIIRSATTKSSRTDFN